MMGSEATPLQFNPPVKDQAWMKNIVMSITQLCSSSSYEKQKDLLCQKYFDGKINDSDFDYLRKIDDYEMPARVRHIPIVRQNLNHLISQETRRAFNFRAYAVDEDSLRFKMKKKGEDFLKILSSNVDRKYYAIQAQIESLNQRKQQIQSLTQREPQNEQEARQIQALAQALPMILAEINMAEKALERESFISKEEVEKLDQYYRFDYCDFAEMKANALLKYGAKASDIGLAMAKKNGFTDKLVMGKELYFVDLIEGNKFPVFQRVHPYVAYWSGDGDNEWIQDGQWCALKYRMSPASVTDWFGSALTPAQKKKLNTMSTVIDYGNLKTSVSNGAVFQEKDDSTLYGGSKLNTGIEVWFTFWKSSREVKVKYSPNRYMPGNYHKHFFDEGEDPKVDEKKGEYTISRYIEDVYSGVQIGNDIFVNLGRRAVQLRNENDFTVDLPLYGLSFNGMDNPYSLIWATKDIQELSNIIHYHRELMLALAGVKGVVMDLAQKPDDMTEKEWLYYRKQGVTFINSLQRRHGRFPTFNQFQTYDDTLSSSIQYLDNILLSLQRLVDEITGVSYQRKGVTVATDQVGTSQSAIQQSMLTTEVLFFEHDETVRRALEGWMNLTKASLEEGAIVAYNDGNGREIINIPAQVFKDRYFNIGVESSAKDEQDISDLRQIALQAFARGQMALKEIVKVYSIDSLMMLQKTVEDFADKAAQTNALMEQNKIQAEAQAKMEGIKFEKEYDKAINDTNAQLKQLELQIKQADLELRNRDLQLRDYIEKSKLQLKDKEINTEAMVEMNYLSEQNRSSRVEELLKTIEMRLNAVMQAHDMTNTHSREVQKLEIEDYKAKHPSKEKIKD